MRALLVVAVLAVMPGSRAGLAIARSELCCWGANRTGVLGIGSPTADSPIPLGPLVF